MRTSHEYKMSAQKKIDAYKLKDSQKRKLVMYRYGENLSTT